MGDGSDEGASSPSTAAAAAAKIDEYGVMKVFELTETVRQRIEAERAAARAARARGEEPSPPVLLSAMPLIPVVPKKSCRLCHKPNLLDVASCTRCGFDLVEDDVVNVPDNVFLGIAQGHIDENFQKILARNDELLVLCDLFPMAETHLDVIPVAPLVDLTHLTPAHVPFLERMRDAGVAALRRSGNPYLPLMEAAPGGLASFITVGFNFPVSVPQLHLHVLLPPLFWRPIFLYPRWHSFEKVVSDLRRHGRVITNQEVPRPAEVHAEHEACLQTGRALKVILLQHAAAGGG
eukprot:tig00021234_g19388.t1